jgi:hypothetical protein
MCKNRRKLLNFVALLLLSVAPAFAAQVPGEVSPAEALRARVLLYYGTLQKGAKTNALELVAPESKNDFFQMNYDGLVKFRVLDVQLADAGDAATVRLLRTDHFSNFPAPLDRETVDHWKRIDDQWYILLPIRQSSPLPVRAGSKELDTPYGKMTFAGQGQNTQQATPPVSLQRPQTTTAVNPRDAMKALQKVMSESSKEKPGDQEKKPEDKKSETQTAPKPNPQN